MIAETTAFTIEGIKAKPVRVEVDVQRGLPAFQMIGLPDVAVREARERVRAAVVNCGYEFPLHRITASLEPRETRKVGGGCDLAIAAALLAATGEIPADALDGWAWVSELALDGSLRPVRGAFAMAEEARAMGKRGIVVAPANGNEAAMALGIDVRTITDISQLRSFGSGGSGGDPATPPDFSSSSTLPDLADLRGQGHLCHGLEIAAAGGHGLLMVGPPGSGKSLAARRLPSILPPLDGEEILEVARIGSTSGVPQRSITGRRPYRAPHHTVSPTGLIGGGSPLRAGEVTLAHNGVLFLDELAEFRRGTLEALKQPLASGEVDIARGDQVFTLPADFQLIAASNPCACGRGPWDVDCECSENMIRRYRAALNGAITGSIDINIGMSLPSEKDLAETPGETSAIVRARVIAARERMTHRYGSKKTNAKATPADVVQFTLTTAARQTVNQDLQFAPAERIHRLLKVARTLADLADRSEIGEDDIRSAGRFTCGNEQYGSQVLSV